MSDNVLIAIVAVVGVVISAFCVMGGAVFAYMESKKQFDKIDRSLALIQADMKMWSLELD